MLDGEAPDDLILLVTGRISGELAYKAARARLAAIATPHRAKPTTGRHLLPLARTIEGLDKHFGSGRQG